MQLANSGTHKEENIKDAINIKNTKGGIMRQQPKLLFKLDIFYLNLRKSDLNNNLTCCSIIPLFFDSNFIQLVLSS